MVQVIEQTQKEKIKMYMKCKKLKLVKMLIECNRQLNNIYDYKMKIKYQYANMCILFYCFNT